MYEKQLQEMGLTGGESKVYIALLNLGSSTVGPIVKKSGIAYSNIYEVLNRLLEKGFVSFTIKEKTKYFQAVPPTRIADYLEKQEQEINRNKKTFQEILPELEKIKDSKANEETEMFIGDKGLKTAYELLTKDEKKEILFFYVHEKSYYEKSEEFYQKTWPMIKEKKIKARGISNEEYRNTKLTKKYPRNIQQKYVSFPVPGNIDIGKDKVLITSLKDKPIGILIYSEEIAENFRRYFESVWKMARA